MKVQKLRRWKQADSGPLRDMDAVCFPTDTSFWNDERYHWWAVSDEDRSTFNSRCMVAYAGLRVEKGIAHFTRAGVMPDYRGQGLQKVLIKARLAWCKRRGIKVVKTYTSHDNTASIASLKACGFRGRKSNDGKWIRFTKEL